MVAIFVILTFSAFLLADAVVQRKQARKELAARGSVAVAPPGQRVALALGQSTVPAGLFLGSGHTWLGVESSGQARLGIDDFVRRAVGKFDAVDLPAEGEPVKKGDKLFAIHQKNRTAVFTSPIDGVVGAVNKSLVNEPDLVEADPYGRGWVCMLKPKHLAASLQNLRVAEEAAAWLKKEVQKFEEFFASRAVQSEALGDLAADGGQITSGVLALMDDQSWDLFNQSFLTDRTQEKSE